MANFNDMIGLQLERERRLRTERQRAIMAWIQETFGALVDVRSPRERGMRFLEEALELCQAVGLTQGDVYNMSRYVYGRPAGNVPQEIGGVTVTLYALGEVCGVPVVQAETDEFERVLTIRRDVFQKRHIDKMERGI